MRSIEGKLALVTGAASGIGRAMALALAQERANLFLLDINEPQLVEVGHLARRAGVEVDVHVCDVSQPDEVRHVVAVLLETWGGLDILVNNAGVAYYGPTLDMTDDQWSQLLAVNLHAPIQLTRALLGVLLDRPEAHVLNVCSIAGLVAGPRLAAYQVSKFGLVGFSESLRAEYGPRGLGVTALCPGLVRTNIFQSTATSGKSLPRFPAWMSTTPERVSRRAIRAIRRSQGVVVVTPMAQFMWGVKRFTPGLLDRAQQLRLRRRAIDEAPALMRRTLHARPNIVIPPVCTEYATSELRATIPFEAHSIIHRRRAV